MRVTDPVARAKLFASAGRKTEALDLLYRAYREHNVWVVWFIKTGAEWDSLRGEPQFKDLLHHLNLE